MHKKMRAISNLCKFLRIGQIVHSDGQEDIEQSVCHKGR